MQHIPGGDEPQQNIPMQNISDLYRAPDGSPYTDEEWKILTLTPLQVGKAMIIAAPSGFLGMVQEVRAMNHVLDNTLAQNTTSPLLKALGQTLKRVVDTSAMGQVRQIKESMIGQQVDPGVAKSTIETSCRQVVSVLRKASPQDAMAYREMVYNVAHKVAEAAREGGFLGISGGQAISKPEQDLLNNLAGMLGIQRS